MENQQELASKFRILNDSRDIQFQVENLEPGYIYEMDFSNIQSTDGVAVMHPEVVYTLNDLKVD